MSRQNRVAITGLGVSSSIGLGTHRFTESLRLGRSNFTLLKTPLEPHSIELVAATIADFSWSQWLDELRTSNQELFTRARKIYNNAPASSRLSARTAMEAFFQSQLRHGVYSAESIGLIVAGSNLHQQFMADNLMAFQKRPESINPRYALSFWDTHQVGCLTELCSVEGMSYSVGGASASGNVALVQAFEWIRSGVLKACIVVGASPDLSALELQGLSIMGATSIETDSTRAHLACRPFDQDHNGFVWGQGSAAVVLENFDSAQERKAKIAAEIIGGSVVMSANHLSNPSLKAEIRAMEKALESAAIDPSDINYINAHGTSTPLGDEVECEAIHRLFEPHSKNVWINSTKSLTGHCLGASSVIELVACVLQMNEGFLHPNLNLDQPIDERLKFVGKVSVPVQASCALSNAFGFGGFNSSLVVRRAASPVPGN